MRETLNKIRPPNGGEMLLDLVVILCACLVIVAVAAVVR